MSEGLSIIIPVYNEQGAIEATLEEINRICEAAGFAFEIIVINDGSTDDTLEKLQAIKLPFKLFSHEKNRGYGAAIKTGFWETSFDTIAITDADSTYPNKKLPEMYTLAGNYDMVVGARSFGELPKRTRPAKWMIHKLANYVVSFRIPDINSGLRVFKKQAFEPFIPIIPEGFSLTTTITLGMLSGGYKVHYIPIDYFVREGKSKIKPVRDTLNFMRLIFKIGLYFAPMKIFLPFSLFLFILGIAWGVFSTLYLGKFADASTIIVLTTAIQIAFLAMIAELINHRIPNFYFKKK